MGTHVSVGFGVVFLLMSGIAELCLCGNSNSNMGCIEAERQTLLKFKASFNNPSQGLLSTWEGNHCCHWKGIACNNVTGHVITLNLGNPCFQSDNEFDGDYYPFGFDDFGFGECYRNFVLEAQNLDPSIMQLKHLTYLDLGGNSFNGSPIPLFLSSMTKLTSLSLFGAGFSGRIPYHIGNLSNLHHLDLSFNVLYGRIPQSLGNLTNLLHLNLGGDMFYDDHRLYANEVSWISQLSSLQHIDMSDVDLGKAHNLFQVLNLVPSLLQIHLKYCGLANSSFPHHPINLTNLTKIEVLDLSLNVLQAPFLDAFRNMTSVSVLRLSHTHLDSLPLWLGEVHNLVHLDLSYCQFQGSIPNVLRSTASLTFLDLSYNDLSSAVPSWTGELKSLVYLNLRMNKLDNIEGSLSSILRNMCSIGVLDLSYNMFQGETLGTSELDRCTKYNLQILDLWKNEFNGSLPTWLGQLKNLRYLNLRSNSFSSSIPSSLGKLSKLETLDLSSNRFNGTIPHSLGQLTNLQYLDLADNHLDGVFPAFPTQLVNLTILNLSNNSIDGVLPNDIGQFVNLQELSLSYNNFNGPIPSSLGQLVNLWILNLSNNHFHGVIPQSFGQLVNLSVLDLSLNSLAEALPEMKGWSQMREFHIANNHITGSIPENIGHIMPELYSLLIGNNQINGSIPNSLCKIEGLQNLDLSNNTLSGNIPDCWKNNQQIEVINLSSNNLSGPIPSSFGNLPSLLWLHLNKNNLNGEIPFSMRNSKKLFIVDLGENQFSGIIPSWTGDMFPKLQILRLRQNKLNGTIPSKLCLLSALQILDLADNHLMGSIPDCIGNLRGMRLINQPITEPLEVPGPPGEHQWEDEDVEQVMKGRELDYTSNLKFLVNMDLSKNNLEGIIPEGIILLTGLLGLNLSHNRLRGEIPKNIGNMKSLESFDISYNKLSGNIPGSMSLLTSLSHLNLSYNNFSGPILTENQFSTLDDQYNYIGNQLLCGASLPKKCVNSGFHQLPGNKGYKEEHDSEKVWFYFVIAIGYAIGFWGVIGILLIKKSWRHACFRWVDHVADKLWITIFVKVARLKRMMLLKNVHG